MDEKKMIDVNGGAENTTCNGPLPGHLCGDGRTGSLVYLGYSTWVYRDIYQCRTCGAKGYIAYADDENWCDLISEH